MSRATQSRVSNEKETKEKVQEKLFASVVGFIDEKTGVLKITSKVLFFVCVLD